MSTGAALAVVRKRSSLSRKAASARARPVMSRMNAVNTSSSPKPIGVMASSTGNSWPSRCIAAISMRLLSTRATPVSM